MKNIADLPKFDLHVHLDGSMRLDTVIELANELPARVRTTLPSDLQSALIPPPRCTLEEYLQAFRITVAVLQTEEALARAAYELCADAAAENVVYMEIRFAPLLHLQEGLTPSQVVEAVLFGMRKAEAEFPLETGLILCGMKQAASTDTIATAELAAAYQDQGVVGFDLAGPERGYPPSIHSDAVKLAKQAGVHVTIHAGEGCCPEHIREAIELGADRIGHGVYLYQDPETEEIVRERGVPLEVCPTSNLQISGVMDSYSEHPLKRYIDLGIPVTINTDNRLMSQITVAHELAAVAGAFSLSEEEVKALLLNSADAAFAPEEIKTKLRQTVLASF